MEGSPGRVGVHALLAELSILDAVTGHYKMTEKEKHMRFIGLQGSLLYAQGDGKGKALQGYSALYHY